MKSATVLLHRPWRLAYGAVVAVVALVAAWTLDAGAHDDRGHDSGPRYSQMPEIQPIGARRPRYQDVPESAKGPAIDPVKGYRVQTLGTDLYMVTENVYQAMFLVYDAGVVVVDVPPSLAEFIPKAIAEVTTRPITHVIYSHAHIDHIGGAARLGGTPLIVAHEETLELLRRAHDTNRPLPTRTFRDRLTLTFGRHELRLSYHGNAHQPGNIFIHAPAQRTLMVVDMIFPGWMPWRRLALAQDVPGYFAQVETIKAFDFDTLVSGHVARTGSKADVERQAEFLTDLKGAALAALKETALGVELDPADRSNPWAVFDNYIDRVALQCVNTLTPKWASRLAAFDVYIWDQCFTMEQSLRLD